MALPDPQSHLFQDRHAILATGDDVLLAHAHHFYSLLRLRVADTADEWHVIYHLRELCLGKPVESDVLRHLKRIEMLGPDGDVDPTLRAVVLSAVRGQGKNIRLSSPFTDATDEALSEFFWNREYLLCSLDPPEKKLLFERPLSEHLAAAIRELPAARNPDEVDPGAPPARLGPPSAAPEAPPDNQPAPPALNESPSQSFTERVMRRIRNEEPEPPAH